jgi:uncharacterized membrane protein YfhO
MRNQALKRFRKPAEYLFSFIIPAFIVMLALAIQKIYPFGDKALLCWDMEIQYADYFGWLGNVLRGEGSIFYSFSKSLGGNMAALFGYYLSSPFNLLVRFFPPERITEFVSWLTLLKIAACGLTAYVYISKRHRLDGPLALCLSSAYALMEYNVSYCSNIMWLDGVMLLPLIALGIHKLLFESRYTLLFVSVAASILFNWYSAYMVCLFAALYFIYELAIKYRFTLKGNVKRGISDAARCLFTVLLSIAAGAVLFLPMCCALMTGGKSFGGFVNEFYFSFLYSLRSLSITAPTNTVTSPVIYISGFALLSAVSFFTNRYVSPRKKAAAAIFIAIFMLSFCYSPFDVIWSDMKRAFSYIFRYSFVFSFLMVSLAADGIKSFDRLDRKGRFETVFRAACFITGTGLVLDLLEGFKSRTVFYLFLMLIIAFGVFLIALKNIKAKRSAAIITAVILLMFSVEQLYNTKQAVEKYRVSNSEYQSYKQEIKNVSDRLARDEDDFFRMEKTFSEMTKRRYPNVPASCESLSIGYRGLAHYSSTFEKDVIGFCSRLGYSSPKNITEVCYNSPLLVTDSLLGIKYVLTDNTVRQPAGTSPLDDLTLSNGGRVYINPYALPLGYAVNNNVTDIKWEDDPFENQTRLVSAMLGKSVNLYRELSLDRPEQAPSGIMWTVNITRDGPVYAYFGGSHSEKKLYLTARGQRQFMQLCYSRFYDNIIYLGDYSEGETISLTLADDRDIDSEHNLKVCSLDLGVFEDAVNALKQNGFSPTVKDGYVSGSFRAGKEGLLMTTIPYNKGWTVKVDGVRADVKKAADCMIAIPLTQGEHKIEMEFRPPYLVTGALISLASVCLFICWRLYSIRRQRRKSGSDPDPD